MVSLTMMVPNRNRTVRILLPFAWVGIAVLTPNISVAASIDPSSGIGGALGSLNFSGSAQIFATFLNFVCDASVVASCPAGNGSFTAGAAQSGSFVPYATDTGFIHSLSQASQPLNTPFILTNFITFNPAGSIQPPDITFTLNKILLGVDPQADCSTNPALAVAGQTCTPQIPQLVTPQNPNGLSALNLTNTPTGSTASFSVSGTVTRISTGVTTPVNGVFNFVFTDTPGSTDGSFQAELRNLSENGSFGGTYTATFSAPVATPEPMTSLLFGFGLVALFVTCRPRSGAVRSDLGWTPGLRQTVKTLLTVR